MADTVSTGKSKSQENIVGRSNRPRDFLRALGAIVWKDLVAEIRSRELLSAMIVFSLLVILIFNFALELDIRTRETVTSGILWVTFAFAGTLGLNRSMAMEKDRGCLDGLLLAPVDRSAIYFGKALGSLQTPLAIPQRLFGLPAQAAMHHGLGAPDLARCQSGRPRLHPIADGDRGLLGLLHRAQEDREALW